jgi:NADPH-dependent glutamate synthase beta subunit-like oxidoreductase/CO/xanthine dehydrogenase FAD-binding subunit
MRTFRYINAKSVREAAAALKQYGRKARIIAGGTDILGEMKDNITRDYPEVIVNIKNVPGLEYIREDQDGLHMGPITRLEDIGKDETVQRKYPALAQAAGHTASPHIREMGTLAGNICQNNRCWYYWVADNRFDCIRKGGKVCYALIGDGRYHSIFGSTRVGTTPCTSSCPDNVDVPIYFSQIRQGDLEGAAATLLASNPLPAITGRVCPHFCEGECNRGEYDEPVSVRAVERVVADYILENAAKFYQSPEKSTSKRVAIIGSGPAGLTAAYYLRRSGHTIEFLERMPQAGGMLTYGIPPYRLPKEVVKKQIQALEKMGIKITTGIEVDKIRFKELTEIYDAVIIASGAWKERLAGIPGEEFLLSGQDFLKNYNSGNPGSPGKKVAVIGAGNVALDVARSLLGMGAEPVIIYRRTRAEMPALQEEVEKAEQEGIRFEFLTLPLEASQKPGKIALKCAKMKLGPPDESGRPRPVPIKNAEVTLEFDAVIKAIGEEPDVSFLPAKYVDKTGRLKINEKTHSLAKGIFAVGDFVTGAATVVAAVAAGRQAAEYIDSFLRGSRIAPTTKERTPKTASPDKFNCDYLHKTARTQLPELTSVERVKNPDREETASLSASQIMAEANRCFNCGCVAVNSSDIAPVLIALNARIRTNRREIDAEDLFTVDVDRTTILADDEIITEITVPRPETQAKSHFSKLAIRKSIDFPIVNCAANIQSQNGLVKSARICLNSVYNLPFRVTAAEDYMAGKPINEENAEGAAVAAVKNAFPVINNRYKIQIARALVKRTILACQEKM